MSEAQSTGPVSHEHGEIVDLTIYGAAVSFTYDGATTYRLPHVDGSGEAHFVSVPDGHASVRVTRRVPLDGVPQPGDIWTDRLGIRYFAIQRKLRHVTGQVELISQEADSDSFKTWESVHAGSVGPIELLYRPTPVPTVEEVATAALVAS